MQPRLIWYGVTFQLENQGFNIGWTGLWVIPQLKNAIS